MRYLAAGISAIVLALLWGAGPACAFTLEPVSPSQSGGSQQLANPGEDAPIQKLTSDPNGAKSYNFGNSGLSFSITGGGYGADRSSTYLDPSQPPQLAPFGYGFGPNSPFQR